MGRTSGMHCNVMLYLMDVGLRGGVSLSVVVDAATDRGCGGCSGIGDGLGGRGGGGGRAECPGGGSGSGRGRGLVGAEELVLGGIHLRGVLKERAEGDGEDRG